MLIFIPLIHSARLKRRQTILRIIHTTQMDTRLYLFLIYRKCLIIIRIFPLRLTRLTTISSLLLIVLSFG